jgi:hypothetical protein
MAIVGYDDAKQAFKVINSWGTSWGSNGYGWISYNLFGLVIDEAYIAVDIPNTSTAPTQPTTDIWQPPQVIAQGPATVTVTNVDLNKFDLNGAVGMMLNGTFTVPAGVQGTMRIVIGLTFQNGIRVGGLSPVFRLASGQAAFGTPPLKLDGSGLTNQQWYAFIPYCVLDVPKTKICINYPTPPSVPPAQSNLRALPALFVNDFGVAQGQTLDFFVKL